MPGSNRRHQAPEACALSAELIALKKDRFNLYHFALFVKELLFPLSSVVSHKFVKKVWLRHQAIFLAP